MTGVVLEYALTSETALIPQVAKVMMPEHARVMAVHNQGGIITLWAMADPKNADAERTFELVTNGTITNFKGLEYIDTVFIGPYVWHVFERVR